MEIEVNQINLARALSVVLRSISSRASLPILSNIKLSSTTIKSGSTKKGVTLSATNLETGIIYNLEAKVDEIGDITLPARVFSELVANLPTQPVKIIQTRSNLGQKELSIQVVCGKHKATIAGMDAKEFPDIPQPSTKPTISLDGKLLNEAIKLVSFAAASDEGRATLTGVLFDLSGQNLVLVATDGYRLSHQKVTLDKKVTEAFQVIVPAKTLTELSRLTDEQKDQKVVSVLLTKEQNQIIFEIGGIILVSRLIEGQFPAWQKVIPQGSNTKALVPIDDFAQAVKIAAVFAKDGANVVRLGFDQSGISISSSVKQLGEQTSQVETKVDGPRNEIAFNVRYLLDLLTHIKDPELEFSMTEPLSPGLFKSAQNPNFIHVIMPIRLQG
ncbi:DNA polymerase III subunit beta [Candidatus Daviesbacteria bacterium]|nr:DNA polymerase III subunit beta [Candidatus Daviesbacteria bacterium]